MQRNTTEFSRTRCAGGSNADHFRFDLTAEQRRLCDWVARQARTGSRQIRYPEATAALEMHEEQLTRMLRQMRERLDEIHAMVEAPIVHTQTPYFGVPAQARFIWDSFRRAEQAHGEAPAGAESAPGSGTERPPASCDARPPVDRVLELVSN